MDTKEVIYQTAPDFTSTDVFGNVINLADFTENYTLLVFLRYSGCPWCNLAIHRLTMEYDRLKADSCQVIAFIQSDTQKIIENIYDRHDPQPQFPIIPDHEMKVYKQYKVKPSIVRMASTIPELPYWLRSVRDLGFKQESIDGNFFLVPAWFLINNKTGKIVRSERGVSFYDHETFTSIYDSLTFKD